METIQEQDGSLRYKKTTQSNQTLDKDGLIFGCEFEFYLNDNSNLNNLIQDLLDISDVDLLVNTISIPSTPDAKNCMQLKPDDTLEDNGLEISTPICSYQGLIKYIKSIHILIAKYGKTNNDTGLHVHISTCDNNGINLDFYKFALLSNEKQLLDSWLERNSYCKNVMNVLDYHNKKDSRDIKSKKDRTWNLHKVSNHHIEIRTMGGENYQLENDKILKELDEFISVFNETLSQDTQEYILLKNNHLEKIKNLGQDIQVQFAKLFITSH